MRGAAPIALALILTAAPEPPRPPAPPTRIRFADAAAEAGLRFEHFNGWSGRRFLVETMGSGVCIFDYDNDGAPDVYLVQGAPSPGSARPTPPPANVLLRNDGRGRFTDVTASAGVGDRGQGMGCVAADVEGDGDLDLYVVNFGPNVLYRNNGDGTFTDVTRQAGVGDDHWGSSAAFADADGDGDLDLYVANYVNFRYERHKDCAERGITFYCSPKAYEAEPPVFYLNDGRGRFRDATREAGLFNPKEAKSLGVVWGDMDDDGDQDLYVANDGERNFLYRNDGHGRFKDVTLLAGVGYSEAGVPQAGMGVDMEDYDGDGHLDLIVTNLSNETNELYRNLGRGIFSDVTFPSGIGSPGLLMTGFGVAWLDAESDGDLDLMVANGHILDNVGQLSDALSYAQPNHLYENLGSGRFLEISARAGPGFSRPGVHRGLALADLDGDGDLDVVVTTNGGPARLLRNDSSPRGHWLMLRLRGTRPNPFAVGAKVELSALGRRRVREVRAGHSYQSQSDLALHFGLGEATRVDDLMVRWPDGRRESFDSGGVDRLVVLHQGNGVRREEP